MQCNGIGYAWAYEWVMTGLTRTDECSVTEWVTPGLTRMQ